MSFHNTVDTHQHTHSHSYPHTNTHTLTQTHPGFSSPHSNLLPVRDLSSAPLDWHTLNQMPFPRSLLRIFLHRRNKKKTRIWSESGLPTPGATRRSGARRRLPELPGSPRGLEAGAGALWPACVPAEPRAAGLELRCLLSASPATRKAVYGDTQCEKGADLKRRRMQARTTKVSYSKVCASPLLSSTP